MLSRVVGLLGPVRPRAFLSGFAASVLMLCVLGRVVSGTSYLQEFQRFHRFLSMDTLYYPTASQLRALAKAALSEGRVLVIVGGSSVMHGVGQGSSELWSDDLQQLLGPAYYVLNFAGGGTSMTDYGGVAAQILYADGVPVLFVSDVGPFGGGDPDGLRARYVFWDAYYKGLLPPDPERMIQVERLASASRAKEELDDLKMRGLLESILYQTDLWNWVGYNVAFTVPNHLIRLPYAWFTAPRKSFEDPTVVSSVSSMADRYPPSQWESQTRQLAAVSQIACQLQPNGAVIQRDPDPPVAAPVAQAMETALPAEVRRRTIIALMPESPFYIDRLTTEQRACYFEARPRMATALSALGYRPVHVGHTLKAEDYGDRVHLLASGGRILARDLASAIMDLSVDLGYLDMDTARASAEEARAGLEWLRALIDAGEGPFSELGELQAQARVVQALDQRLNGARAEVEQAEASASKARVDAQQLRAWIDAGGPVAEANRSVQLDDRNQVVQQRENRARELADEVSAARARAGQARRETEGIRAEIDGGRAEPGEMARLQTAERSLQERDRRLRDLIREAEKARLAADEARAELTKLDGENRTDRAVVAAIGRLREQERYLQQEERRLRDLLDRSEEARVAAAEARAEVSRRCALADPKRALPGVTTRLQEREVRRRERLLCSSVPIDALR